MRGKIKITPASINPHEQKSKINQDLATTKGLIDPALYG